MISFCDRKNGFEKVVAVFRYNWSIDIFFLVSLYILKYITHYLILTHYLHKVTCLYRSLKTLKSLFMVTTSTIYTKKKTVRIKIKSREDINLLDTL